MDVNYELYKVFYHVASSLSFSEASKKLFISQSAVSQSIKTLERKLGQPLFVRSTKKVRLTHAGTILLKHIEPAIHLISRGENQLLNASTLGFGQLHIAASDTICRYLLVPHLKQFHQSFPHIPIKVTNATSLHCVDLLEQGKVDVAIINSPNSRLNPSYARRTLRHFQDVFLANPSYYDVADQEISLKELKQYPILALGKNNTTGEFLHQLFLQHQLDLVPQIELSSNDLLIDLARIGLGIAFIPDYCLKPQSRDLCVLKIQEQIPMRQIVAAINTSLPISASTEEFLELLPEASC